MSHICSAFRFVFGCTFVHVLPLCFDTGGRGEEKKVEEENKMGEHIGENNVFEGLIEDVADKVCGPCFVKL